MKPTQRLHDMGQSLWLDNITRDLLSSGTLAGYIAELSATRSTSTACRWYPCASCATSSSARWPSRPCPRE